MEPELANTAEPRWEPEPGVIWRYYVDIVGRCNLACPSCPVGNMPEVQQPTGYMKPELLDAIVRKAKAECAARVKFALFNWTEPLLHPKLAEMIEVVNSHGLKCGLSSNLNIVKDIDAVMRANPSYLKVSLSGFTQDSYGVTHRKGKIEVVKRNMAIVADAKRRAWATTRLTIAFHRYLGNHEDERRMKEYAESLGFEFGPYYAYLMPLEKNLAFAEPETTDTQLTSEDQALIGRLALPLDLAIEAAKRRRHRPCRLRDQEMAINCEGRVMLCCAVYERSKNDLGSYLDVSLEDLQKLKYEHNQCTSCMRNGIHVLATGDSPVFDTLARENEARLRPESVAMREHRHQSRGFYALPRKMRKEYGKLKFRAGQWIWRKPDPPARTPRAGRP